MELVAKILFFGMLVWVVPLTIYMMYVTTLDIIEDFKRRLREWRDPV